ncbi:peptidoglycan-binding protein [Pedobacter heparinus]|uniref:peptidoglycan-binding protein n=1 Tax=Pedobacter heparinus TaxID=984 RepID=UPI002930B1B6|nr:peptidoglycan-binding protein [Pedobacter heparinus]
MGIKAPAAWCSAWLSWVFGQAGYKQPRTAWSPALFPASRLVAAPRPGIVYGLYFASLKRIAHCGITERIQGDFIVGLEGNTNLAGSREGDGVFRKIRHKRTIYCYADWL